MFSSSLELKKFLENRFSFHKKQAHFWRFCHYLSLTLSLCLIVTIIITISKSISFSFISKETLLILQIPILLILLASIFYFKKFKILWKIHQEARFNLELLKIEMLGGNFDEKQIKSEIIKNIKSYQDTLKQLFGGS